VTKALTKLKYEIFGGQLNAPGPRRDRYNEFAKACRGNRACQERIAKFLKAGKVNFQTAKARAAHKKICSFKVRYAQQAPSCKKACDQETAFF